MSRIPDTERLQFAKEAQAVKAFAEHLAIVQKTLPKSLAAMIALNHEAADVIARLAVLVERGSSPVLIDKAATAVQSWNHAVHEAGSVTRSELHLGPR